jgi:hypothetical protein
MPRCSAAHPLGGGAPTLSAQAISRIVRRVSAAPADARPLTRSNDAWSRTDSFLLAALFLGTVCVRVLTLRTIDLGGDATFKWFFVRTWQYANPWVFDHHTARFSVNVPTYLVQRVFGSHPNGMYLPPLLAAVAQAPLLYGCGRALGSRGLGVVAGCLTWLFEPAVDASSQLLPGVFQATYLLAAVLCCLRFAEEPGSRRSSLAWAGVWLFAAYLAMVTTVYALPGVALAIWLVRRRVLDAAIVLGGFAAWVGLETLGYALWTPYPFGQFQVILRTHTNVVPTTLLGLVLRTGNLPRDWLAVLAVWLLCALAFVALRRGAWLQPSRPGRHALWLVPASVLAGMSIGIKRIQPIVPATEFRVRYYDVLVPLLALGLAALLVWSASWLLRRRPLPVRVAPALAGLGMLASVLFALGAYAPRGAHAFELTHEQFRALNDAAAHNHPIVGSNRSDHLQMKTLTCVQWAYLEDRFLLSNGELRLRKLGKASIRGRTHRYWSADRASPDAVAAAIKQRRCLVTVMRRDGEPKLGLSAFAGPECSPSASSP